MDLTDLSSVQEVVNEVKPDIVFHLAAQSFPKASFNMRTVTFETNIIGTDNLLHSLKELKINQLFIYVLLRGIWKGFQKRITHR